MPRRLHSHPARGFTIIEMIVVVGMITLLMALIFPSIRGALGASRKTRELSNIRQVFQGWTMYSSQNDERMMPGFIDEAIAPQWGVTFETADGTDIDPEFTDSYPWRLAPFVDYSYELFLGYRQDAEEDINASIADVSNEPAFGYNAYHLGGWWIENNGSMRITYHDATDDANQPIDVVIQSASGIQRTDEVVVFCSSVLLTTPDVLRDYTDITPGCHYVQPAIGAEGPHWAQSQLDVSAPQSADASLSKPVAAPRTRYNRSTAIVTGDGHTETVSLFDLQDQRRFLDRATTAVWTFKSPDSP